jgi:outer membrane protein OmpA-like peptidoglycan-associated protein
VQLQQISFEYNSDKLTSEAKKTLDNLAIVIKEPDLAKSHFKIVGHTDAMGGAEFNLSLSIRRAQSAMSYLVNHHHVDANRLTIEGKGFSELADPAHPDSAANRRVQVTNLGQS